MCILVFIVVKGAMCTHTHTSKQVKKDDDVSLALCF